ncbi:hypothetical protein [Psychrobacillus phage Perkons]|nr:hypothetical protein [Psychrobacillus phage Perkons]
MKLYALYKDIWFLVIQNRERKGIIEYLLCSSSWWSVDVWVSKDEVQEFKEELYDEVFM